MNHPHDVLADCDENKKWRWLTWDWNDGGRDGGAADAQFDYANVAISACEARAHVEQLKKEKFPRLIAFIDFWIFHPRRREICV